MKPLRVLLILSGVLLAFLAVVAGAALTPSIQRWALLRWASGQAGLKLEADRVAVSLGSARLEGVRFEHSGAAVAFERLEARFDWLASLTGRSHHVQDLSFSGLDADLTAYRPAARAASTPATAAAPAAVPGLLAQLRLPLAVSVDRLNGAGRVRLPGSAGAEPVRVDFKLTVEQFGPGREGVVRLEIGAEPGRGGPVDRLAGDLSLRLAQSTELTFSRVECKGRVEASGPQLPVGRQILFDSTLYRTGTGDDYSVQADLVSGAERVRLVSLRASLPQGSATYSGEWNLAVGREQVAPFTLGYKLPNFTVRGSGRFSANPIERTLRGDGTMQADVNELEALDPAWRAFGAVRVVSDFALRSHDGVVDFDQLKLSLAGAKPVLDLVAAGALQANLRSGRLQVAPRTGPVNVDLQLRALPVAWIRPFLTDIDLSGTEISGALAYGRPAADTEAKIKAQFVAPELNVVRAGQLLLRKGEGRLELAAGLAGDQLSVERFLFALSAPTGDRVGATGSGRFGLNAGAPTLLKLQLNASSARSLARWFPGEPVTLQADLDASWHDGILDLASGRMEVAHGARNRLLTVMLPQPFRLDPLTRVLTPKDATRPVAVVETGRLPLALLTSLPGVATGGIGLTGELREARIEVTAEGGRLAVRAPQPWVIPGFSLQASGRPLLNGTSLALQPRFELDGARLTQASSGEVLLRDETGLALLQFTADFTGGGAGDLRASLTFNANLPVLGAQPFINAGGTLAAGRASGEVRAARAGGVMQLESRATLNGLVLREGGRALPVANLSLRSVIQPDGRVTLQAPLLVDRAGKRSDLNLEAQGLVQPGAARLETTISGTQVELDDVMLLLAAFGAPTGDVAAGSGTAVPDRALSPPSADPVAFWQGLRGGITLDLKSVQHGSTWTMTDLTGRLQVREDRIELEKLAAAFGPDSLFAAQGLLSFAAGPEPYALKGGVELSSFDAGKFLKALEPAQPPVVEGLFDVKASFAGGGLTLADLSDRVRGDFALTSRAGVFRGLKRSTDKVSVVTKAVELGAALGSLLGTSKVGKAAEKVAGQTYQVDQLAQSLGEFKYDRLSLHVLREANLDVQLRDIALVSPEIRLTGVGTITHTAGKPLLDQPLSVTLTLGARGRIEELLGKLKVLDAAKDELGYARAKEKVNLGGTPAKPDPTPFFTRLASAKVSDLLSPEN